jgi:hypothetical protein
MKLFRTTKKQKMTILPIVAGSLLAPLIVFMVTNSAEAAAAPVPLGTTTTFAVLAASTVTNTGSSVINGGIGLSPGTSITGFPPGTDNGATHATDAVAGQAQTDLTTAYNNAMSQGPTSPIVADLGGQTLLPGVYNSASSLGLTGTVTLDGGGDPNAVFVFQATNSTLTTASASNVSLINGAQACNVFWQVGSSATLGTGSSFEGTVLAMQSITVNTGATIFGRVLARNGAVTLDSDTITTPACTTPSATATTATTATPASSTPTTAPGASSATTATPAQLAAQAAVAKKAAAAAKIALGKAGAAVPGASIPAAPPSPINTVVVHVTG